MLAGYITGNSEIIIAAPAGFGQWGFQEKLSEGSDRGV